MNVQFQLDLIRRTTCAVLLDDFSLVTSSSANVSLTGTYSNHSTEATFSTPGQRIRSFQTNSSSTDDAFPVPAVLIATFLLSRVVPLLCAVGLVGNISTIILLASHSVRRNLGRMEKFATSGLAILSATDALFCLSAHPLAFVSHGNGSGSGNGRPEVFESTTFRLLYSVYHNAVISTFTAISSWITVTLAVVRYIAVCRPLWARFFIGPTTAACFFSAVIFSSAVLNVPRFFVYRIEAASCHGSKFTRYFKFYGWLRYHPTVGRAYWWIYAVFSALLPFCLLAFANFNLLGSLRRASAARAAVAASPRISINRTSSRNSNRRASGEIGCHVTLTLVIVVGLYLVLATPADVINVLRELFPEIRKGLLSPTSYNLCVAVVNTLQAANFSLNFIVYCIINVHFRSKLSCVLRKICCRARRNRGLNETNSSTFISTRYQIVQLNVIRT